ncbi:MAG: tetratricopeptide repeat protein [Acidobacteriota bacterium]
MVNGVFLPAIRHVEERDGSILGFGGDSLQAVFTGACAVGRARAAAEGIQQCAGPVETTVGSTMLGIAQVVHFGMVHGAHVAYGDRRHYIACGPGPAALALQEQESISGEILLSPQAARRIEREPAPPPPRPPSRLPALSAEAEAYLPPHVVEGTRWLRGAFRHVVIAFFETRGARIDRLQSHFETLAGTLAGGDATLVGSDVTPRGVRWLCAFGAPRSHEDDAERAAAVARALLATGSRHARGGMHAGIAAAIWMGSPSRCSFETIGDVTNTAARTLAKAAWGEVLVTDRLRQRIRGFDATFRGSHAVKGKRDPLELYAIARPRRAKETAPYSSLLIGRSAELGRLRGALDAALRGEGRTVSLSGEPGMGKSRLRLETRHLAETMEMTVHEGRTRSFGGRPYEPFAELLRSCLGLGEEVDPATLRRRLWDESDLDERERHHLADVLGTRFRETPLDQLDGRAIRDNNAAALAAYLRTLARRRPRLYVLEDLQWADDMTRDALPRVVWALRGEPALCLLVHRPGFVPPDPDDAIVLAELPARDAEELVCGLLGKVARGVVSMVLDHAGGNPFFVEELVRYLRDRDVLGRVGDGSLALGRAIPELPGSLESVIDARLSDLPPAARHLVQVGAVIGRRFRRRLLSGFPELERGMDRTLRLLESRQIIFTEPPPQEPGGLVFKHALMRDVAYAGILVAERRRIHRIVAETLESGHPSANGEEAAGSERLAHLALLGHHWEHAGDLARARASYLAAGRHAARTSVYAEAEALYRSWLRLEAPGDPEGAQVRISLGDTVLSVVGRRNEARVLLEEAARIARDADDRDACASALKGMAIVDMTAGRFDDAERELREALRLVPGRQNDSARAIVLNSLGALMRARGRRAEARRAFSTALAVHRRDGHVKRSAVVLGNLGVIAYEEGQSRRAERLYREALDLHRAACDRPGEGRILGNLAAMAMGVGRMEESQHLLEAALEIHTSTGNRPSECVALSHISGLKRQLLELPDAIAAARRGLAIARDVSDREREAMVHANLGALLSLTGRHAEAREHHRSAVAIALELDAVFTALYIAAWARHECVDGDRAAARQLVARAARVLARRPAAGVSALLAFVGGALASDAGRSQQSQHLLETAIRLAERDSPAVQAAASIALSFELHRRDRVRSAANLVRRAETIYAAARDRGGILAVPLPARDSPHAWRSATTSSPRLAIARSSGSDKLLCHVLCELAHARLDAGADPTELAAGAAESLARLDVGPRSTAVRAMAALRRRLAGRRPAGPLLFQLGIVIT